MANDRIVIEGLPELIKKIDNLQDMKRVNTAMRAAALHVKGKIAQYPPESEANRPKERGTWYERGYGTRWPGGGRKTSQTLGRKWTIASRDKGLTQIVGNNVTYGPYVQDEDMQAWFHKRRGWKTTQTVAEEEADTVVKFVKSEIDKIINE